MKYLVLISIVLLVGCGKKEGTPMAKCINGVVYTKHWNEDFYTNAGKSCIKDPQ
jgi:major membrane immunogen (membrane-anchored lipoprotein)